MRYVRCFALLCFGRCCVRLHPYPMASAHGLLPQQVFVRFLDGQVSTLPWCEQAPAPETSAIASSLKLLNANGYLTINSQVGT